MQGLHEIRIGMNDKIGLIVEDSMVVIVGEFLC